MKEALTYDSMVLFTDKKFMRTKVDIKRDSVAEADFTLDPKGEKSREYWLQRIHTIRDILVPYRPNLNSISVSFNKPKPEGT